LRRIHHAKLLASAGKEAKLLSISYAFGQRIWQRVWVEAEASLSGRCRQITRVFE
jgi:hypothetical protein